GCHGRRSLRHQAEHQRAYLYCAGQRHRLWSCGCLFFQSCQRPGLWTAVRGCLYGKLKHSRQVPGVPRGLSVNRGKPEEISKKLKIVLTTCKVSNIIMCADRVQQSKRGSVW